MRKVLLLLVLLAWAAPAAAVESWRVGNRIITVGDSVSTVLQVAGDPDYREQLETAQGGGAGYRWYYVRTGYNAKTVIVTINRGQVLSIEMEKN